MAFGLNDQQLAGAAQNYRNSAQGQLPGVLGGADPRLSPQASNFAREQSNLLNEQVRRGAFRTARNRIKRGGVLARLLGLDRQQSQAARLGNEQGAAEDISNTIGEGELQNSLGMRDFRNRLFMGDLDFQRQQQEQRRQEKAQRGGFWGQALGAGLSLIPGGGLLGAGANLFGGGGGSRPPRMGESGFRY